MFKDRHDAGHRLGKRLLRYKDRHPVVLALPRGGVPVAFEVASILAAPLDVVLVRRLVAPGHPDLTVATVIDGDPPGLEPEAALGDAERLGLTPAVLEAELHHHAADLERRRALYRDGAPAVDLVGRTAIVVDDAVAGAVLMRAAVTAARRAGAARVVAAAPAATAEAADEMAEAADETAFLFTSQHAEDLPHCFGDFRQVHDGEAVALLRRSRAAARSAPG